MARRIVVTLLRHSITDYNEQKRYLGWTDAPLNENGKNLLRTMKEKYRYPISNRILSSDLKRCVDTCSELYPTLPIEQNKNLREIHFGEWEGRTYEELRKDDVYQKWLENPESVVPPGGESFLQFEARVLGYWKQIVSEMLQHQEQHLVIVSHGGPIRLILSRCIANAKQFWDWQINYGQGYSLTIDRGQLQRGEQQWTLLQEEPFMEKATGCTHIIK